MLMKVTKTLLESNGIPDYYELYHRWWTKAMLTGENFALQEAYRFARLAEEFGLAVIEEDTTQEDIFRYVRNY